MAQAVIGALRVNLGIDSAQFTDGLTGARAKMARFGKNMQKVGAGLSVVGAGIAIAIRGQLNNIDEISKKSQAVGLTTEAFSQLQYAAELSGVSMRSLESGLQRMAREMVDNEEKFTSLGVAIRDANGEMLPTEEVLGRLGDVFASMPDGAEKTALAVDLLGRSGAEMIPLLNGGAEALNQMMQEADALGLTISGETAKAAEEFNDNITRLKTTISGLLTQITAQLAPFLATFSDVLVGMTEGFRNLSPNAQQFSAIIAGLAIVVGPLVVAVGLLVTALAGISAPVLLAIAAITVLTAGLSAFWPEIVAVKDAIIDMIKNGVDLIKVKFEAVMTYLRDLPSQMLQIGGDIIDGLVNGILAKWENVKGSVTGVWDDMAGGVKDFFRIRSPSRLMMEYGGYISEGLAVGIKGSSDLAVSEMNRLAQQVDSAAPKDFSGGSGFGAGFDSFIDEMGGAIASADSLGEAFSNMRDVAKNALQDLAASLFSSGIKGLFSGLLGGGGGGLFSLFSGPSIAANANGTNNFKGGLSSVHERGGEIMDLPRGTRIIPNDISKRMADGSGGGVLQVSLSPDLEARILQQAQGQSIEITGQGIQANNKNMQRMQGRP